MLLFSVRYCIALFLIPAAAALAQAPAGHEADLGPPTEGRVRFTPGMARGIAGLYCDDVLVRRYGLDETKKAEAVEALSRRLMAAAHASDGQFQPLTEFLLTQVAEMRAHGDHRPGPEFLKGLGERMLPITPAMRELIGGVGQDIRPMLPFKQQLKLTADLALAGTAMDAFEKNMQRWSKGEGNPGENPFEGAPQDDPAAKERIVKNARLVASQAADRDYAQEWKTYLEQAQKFYVFDEAQSATGESILREFIGRAQTFKTDAAARENVYQSRLWMSLAAQVRIPGAAQLQQVITARYEKVSQPLRDLERQFKGRIDEIPTEAQRTAADERLLGKLTEHGYTTTAEAQP
jgi:hypothetical protein